MRATRIKLPGAYIKARNKRYREIDDVSIFDVCMFARIFFTHRRSLNCGVFATQLRWSALRGDQGLQQVGGLPAGRLLRGQPIPEQLERRVRGGRVAIRPV